MLISKRLVLSWLTVSCAFRMLSSMSELSTFCSLSLVVSTVFLRGEKEEELDEQIVDRLMGDLGSMCKL